MANFARDTNLPVNNGTTPTILGVTEQLTGHTKKTQSNRINSSITEETSAKQEVIGANRPLAHNTAFNTQNAAKIDRTASVPSGYATNGTPSFGSGRSAVSNGWPVDTSQKRTSFKFANGVNITTNRSSTLTTLSFSSALTSQTFMLPKNVDLSKSVIIECIGAGGSSFADDAAGPGGGGGAYSKVTLTSLNHGDTLYITVGASEANSDGGDSKVVKNGANLVLAKGGKSSDNGGSGGAAIDGVGDTRTLGGNGSAASGETPGAGGASGNNLAGGNGGSGSTGGASVGIGGSGGDAGANGSDPGGGAGGVVAFATGKLGGTGLVKFTYYILDNI